MTTKANRDPYGVAALRLLAQYARTHAGDLASSGRSRQAREMRDTADWLSSLVDMFRADGRGLPGQQTFWPRDEV